LTNNFQMEAVQRPVFTCIMTPTHTKGAALLFSPFYFYNIVCSRQFQVKNDHNTIYIYSESKKTRKNS